MTTQSVPRPKTPSEIREAFLRFFQERGHTRTASDSLVPENDPSLLFTGAGMNQFKDEFLGRGKRGLKRATTSQKCIRTGDLDNVGRTYGHHSFFEMLGNFSFGDYFKREAIHWAWEFLTSPLPAGMGIDSARLAVTVYEDDTEAYDIWLEKPGDACPGAPGLPPDRIFRLGAKSNFWPSNAPNDGPNGPCGPCSEIFFDYGVQPGWQHAAPCDPACDCGRYIEVWNLVFTQFDRQDGGVLVPLPQKNIDTGMGLERLVAVAERQHYTMETTLFADLISSVRRIAGNASRFLSPEEKVRTKRIADHVRAACFLLSDGVRPGNEGRGYVLRRLIRRAVRDGEMLGISRAFLSELPSVVSDLMGDAYPAIRDGAETIAAILRGEESQFRTTFRSGAGRLDAAIRQVTEEGGTSVSGDVAFLLHDTYGFPVEMTLEIAAERGLTVETARFGALMEEQRDRARGARKVVDNIFEKGAVGELEQQGVTRTRFLGYEEQEGAERRGTFATSVLRGIIDEKANKLVAELAPGAEAALVLDASPFYAESGGQIGDTGEIRAGGGVFIVTGTIAIGGYSLHRGTWQGTAALVPGVAAEAQVDHVRRDAVRRNHTATHLLHKALKDVLGDRVNQAGSLVAPDRLRFDFTFDRGMTSEEIALVEDKVNAEILKNDDVVKRLVPLEEARRSGAMALFGEKYPDPVRVVSTGDYSVELCGGTHVRRTGDIGSLRILSEGSVASGIRRVEATTGDEAVKRMQSDRDLLSALGRKLGVPAREIGARLDKLQEELKQLRKRPAAAPAGATAFDPVSGDAIAGKTYSAYVHLVTRPRDEVAAALEAWMKKPGDAAIALVVCKDGDKIVAIAAGNKPAVDAGFNAGNFIKATGGRGGGKPNYAQGTFPGEPTLDDLRAKTAAAIA